MLDRIVRSIGKFVAGAACCLALTFVVGCGDKDSGPKEKSEPAKHTEPADEGSKATGDNHAAATDSGESHSHDGHSHIDESATKSPQESDAHAHAESAAQPSDKIGQPYESQEVDRQAILDALYAQIRLQMEQAIAERKELLSSGTPASDERVRALEGRIMKARGYLIENGEFVEDVDPPIVERQPG
ncbi:MAG: hypothetical protein KF841_05145 [Phycisphaerae bacterium]|nr:hypothetical protein [Phycisphaerae bacterium]